jgi:15-cis-phytoene synthase
MSAPEAVAAAYERCEEITRAEAANFYYGIRLLPRERRRAICAVYAFARRVDDIGDGTLERAEKLRRLDAEADVLDAVEGPGPLPGGSSDPVALALADAYGRFPLPPGALGELIEGVRMDVNGVGYEGFEELVLYCRRVAGAIGRVCLAIFGLRSGQVDRAGAERLADELGVAMQLTNILRDLREDAENGRVYLPAEDLRRFGVLAPAEPRPAWEVLASLASDPVAASNGARPGSSKATVAEEEEGLIALVRFEAARARQWFARGIALTRVLDRRSAASVLAMAGIYHRLLDRIDAHPEEAVRRRISLPAHEKAWVAVRGMLGARP